MTKYQGTPTRTRLIAGSIVCKLDVREAAACQPQAEQRDGEEQ